jgi:hypothetical protein
MAEEGKSQTYVETHKAIAAGIASVIAAVFTSKLGVAGTLIGTAVTAVLITLGSAVFKAQLMKASHRIAGLPETVRGRLSTQQVRIPGKPNAEPNPEPAAKPEATNKRPGLLSRLRAVPGFLRELPSAQRRRVLVAGLLAGLMATVIGLGAVTGIELVGGKTLSCLVWSCPDDSDSEESSSSSGLSIFGGRSYGSSTDTQSAPSGDQPVAPGNQQQVPGQPNGQPAQPGTGQPSGPPQDADPSQSGTEPGTGVNEEPTPPENRGSEKGRGLVPEEGNEKEDRY